MTLRTYSLGAVVAAALMLGNLPVGAQDVSYAERVEDTYSYHYGGANAAVLALQRAVEQAASCPEKSALAERALIAGLRAEATDDAREIYCHLLARVGGAAAVPVLEALLAEPRFSEAAIFALVSMPGSESLDALRRALATTDEDKSAVALINALGQRRDEHALSMISGIVRASRSEAQSRAALWALGEIGTPLGLDALCEDLENVELSLREPCERALVRCAEGLAESGSKDAVAVLEQLYENGTGTVRHAALAGLLRSEGRDSSGLARVFGRKESRGIELFFEALISDDPDLQKVALSMAHNVPGEGFSKRLASRLDELDPAMQVALIEVLGDRGHQVVCDPIRGLADSDTEDVRLAALKALAGLGDTESIELLVAQTALARGPAQRELRLALDTMPGEEVDEALLDRYEEAEPAQRGELARCYAARGVVQAIPLLAAEVKAEESGSAREAVAALADLAREEDLPKLLDLLGATEGSTRERVAKALAAAGNRLGAQEEVVSMAAQRYDASEDTALKIALLDVLGSLGGQTALATVREALDASDDALREAALRAMTEWPGVAPLDDLLARSNSAEEEKLQILALRGYFRILDRATEMRPKERLARYKAGLEAAQRPAEIRLALAGLGNLGLPGAAAPIEPYLNDEELRNDAAIALLKLAERLAVSDEPRAKRLVDLVESKATEDYVASRIEEVRAAIEKYRGYIASWRIAGPYEGREMTEVFDTAYPPESGDEAVEWKRLPNQVVGDQPDQLDFIQWPGGNNRAVYLETWVQSDKARKVTLSMGSDDGMKCWLNGELVHAVNMARAVVPGSDIVKAELNKGWNRLMVKVVQASGGWGLSVRILDADGGTLPGLAVSSTPPESVYQ